MIYDYNLFFYASDLNNLHTIPKSQMGPLN